MATVGRNAPCPCGSGKKYKKCCLVEEQERSSIRRGERAGVSYALQWLRERYPNDVKDVIRNDFYGDLKDEEVTKLEKLSPGLLSMLDVNIGEWLIADAKIPVKGAPKLIRKLLLEPGGPLLSAEGRDWLQRLVENPLSLYEVRQAKPGEGLQLSDLLLPDGPAVWVHEESASRSLVRWDVIGARLVRQESGWVLSGAAYPFAREDANACREEIIRQMEGEDWGSDFARELVGTIIIGCWLKGLIVERQMPRLVDASTKEPIMLVTEHYQVKDWEVLSNLLAAQPDVEGDRKEGWVRFAKAEGGTRRPRAELNVKQPNFLEVFCRTLKLADEARAWLEDIAGAVLRYKLREIADPRSPKAQASASKVPPPDIPPDIKAQLLREALLKYYADWTEKPIPALGNKSPRRAIKTEAGRRAVIELLKSYEQQAARMSRDQGDEPFDFGFLWDRLGMKQEP